MKKILTSSHGQKFIIDRKALVKQGDIALGSVRLSVLYWQYCLNKSN